MRLLLSIVVIAALVAPAFAQEQEPDWASVTTSTDSNDSYSIKLHSGERTRNKKGEGVTVVVGKVAHKKENNIDIYKWYVTDTDCAQGYGNFVVLDMNDAFQFESPYAKGSETIGSSIADVICAVGASVRADAAGKGI